MGRFLSELRRRKVFHTAAVYAGVAAVVWGAANDALPALGFPEGAVTLVVLATLLGFPVAVVLAWFFEVRLEETARLEPGKGLAPEEAETPVPGPAPPRRHRWWLVAAGAAAVAVLTPLIGLRLTSVDAGFPRDAEPAVIDQQRIAVLPFRVASASPDLAGLREGMLDLLSPLLTESPSMVDARTTLAAWRRAVPGEDRDLSEEASVDLARHLGAGRVLLGSVVGTASQLILNARLLDVSSGNVVGDATVEGADSSLFGLAGDLAAGILGLAAGEQRDRVEYLGDTPLQAVREYVAGQARYRRADYGEAIGHFNRALDLDSTFALAALGLMNAADQYPLGRRQSSQRAEPILRAYLDRLPQRERLFAEFLLRMDEPMSAVERVEDAARIVQALPDHFEAWGHLGNRLFHYARWVADTTYLDRAEAAWTRARALDPEHGLARQREGMIAMARRDTARYLANAEVDDEDPGPLGRSILAYEFGDTAQRRWVRESMDTLSASSVASLLMGGSGSLPADVPEADMDRWLEAVWAAAVTPAERIAAADLRHRVFRSLGRTAEAEEANRMRSELRGGAVLLAWLMDPLYWEGTEDEGRAWMARLEEQYGGKGGPIMAPGQAVPVCLWQIWAAREGHTEDADWAVAAVREASPDPDPTHLTQAMCAALLETVVAHERGAPEADSLVAELRRIAGQGLHGFGEVVHLELARLLEARGEYRAAARAVFRVSTGMPAWPWGNFMSTMVHEAGRLYDAAGDVDQALYFYRWYLLLRKRPDPHLQPEADRIRARVAELEARGR